MKNKKSKNTLIRLLSYTKPYVFLMIVSIISAIITVAVTLLIPILIGDAIDYMIEGNVDFDSVFKYIYTLIALILVGTLFQWILTACTNSLAFRTVRDMRNELFEHINKLPLKYLDTKQQGDITARISSDMDLVSEGLLQGFTQLFSGVLTIVATLGVLFYYNWIIALVVVVLTPMSLFVASFITKRSHSTFIEQATKRGEASGFVEEVFSGHKLVQAFNQEEAQANAFEPINQQLYTTGFKSQFYGALVNPCTRFVNNMVYASVGVIGALISIWANSPTPLSPGLLSAFLMYANQYTKPFNEITGVLTEIQSALAASKRVFAVLDEKQEESDKDNTVLTDCDGTINIENVYFSYVADRPLIENLNLNVKQGQKVAIVGPTGCGKTTLINLLMRFYDVNQGRIVLSQHDIKDITRKSLRDNYGMVLQDSWLFLSLIHI